MSPILCLDFDGVLHSYTSGWQGEANIPDPPVEGAQAFVEAAQNHFKVVVVSSRCHTNAGRQAVRQWLEENGFPEGVEVVMERPAAFVTLDDRALTFTGKWPPIETLREFKPWWK